MNTIRHIRTHVFRVSQAEFAALAGVRQSTVSRWEKGEGASPSLGELTRIRTAAAERELVWDDSYFFVGEETAA